MEMANLIESIEKALGESLGKKSPAASNRVKARSQAIVMLAAGATRLGTSSSVGLVSDESRDKVASAEDHQSGGY